MTSKITKPTVKSTKTYRSPEAIEGHIAQLGARINELRPMAEQFAKMAAAADAMQQALQQVEELRAELDESKAHLLRTQANALRVLSVHKADNKHEGIIVCTVVEIEQDQYSQDYGRSVPVRRTVPLHSLNAAEQLAVLESQKLPPYILKLADTPTEALAKWQAAYRRGYLTD
ncbi:hypothetical protein EPIRMAN_GEN20615_19125 [Ralstonia mannitolilytica]|uniref:hypothetical protein n=1 Tax=Ralstonia mannitolilytica TaxID=105219 RepID=UPI0005D9C1D4|nr:hypothetical protein [Ralstonia mannitolilytica]AJW45484.1 hypothetical protein TK49_12670 [Ralstonia mannitolilytica]QIF07690.1 hypothetical protein G5A69_08380 [Ralstonia mannitolilytica]CAJ0783547.1 hypothetical protein R77555_01089 [Ralstonia mannitolilytica]